MKKKVTQKNLKKQEERGQQHRYVIRLTEITFVCILYLTFIAILRVYYGCIRVYNENVFLRVQVALIFFSTT